VACEFICLLEDWPLIQLQRSEGRERRRLTLCPTGAFMQVPLHAAGIYTGDHQVSCSDYFVASYTPSIAALLHAQQSAKPVRHAQADTLLVAVDQPFQGTPLPMTRKEADTAQRLVSPSAKVVRISSCDEMLNHIQSASILHLACHGTQDPANALQSSFHLEDGLLPVSRLMELELPSAFLAVLSACETAKADSAQPDQAIYLAATMLFVGFKSVVATMWYVYQSRSLGGHTSDCHSLGSWETQRAPTSPRVSTRRSSVTTRRPSISTQTMCPTHSMMPCKSCVDLASTPASGRRTYILASDQYKA
jgi:CHAT domain-containing protein